MQSEVWAEVPSWPGLLASSLGRLMVKSYQKEILGKGLRTYGGRPTSGQWDGKRFVYPRRGFGTKKVARLVCEAFHGPPKPGQVCMHLNEDSRDNRPENLRWGSQKENLNAPGFLAYCKTRTGEKNPNIIGIRRRNTQPRPAAIGPAKEITVSSLNIYQVAQELQDQLDDIDPDTGEALKAGIDVPGSRIVKRDRLTID